jgi:hypothetical protein
MMPSIRTVLVEGFAEGAKFWMCEGNMRGVLMESMIVVLEGCRKALCRDDSNLTVLAYSEVRCGLDGGCSKALYTHTRLKKDATWGGNCT